MTLNFGQKNFGHIFGIFQTFLPITQSGLETNLESTFTIEEKKKRYLIDRGELRNAEHAKSSGRISNPDKLTNPEEELIDFHESVVVLEDDEHEM